MRRDALTRLTVWVVTLLVAAGVGGRSAQASNTATNSGLWSNAAIWDAGAPPVDGDDAVIAAGKSVTNDSAVAAVLSSLSVVGTLTFDGWESAITATNITVTGTVTHKPNTATAAPWTPNARVYFICTNLLVATGGAINTDQKGYGYGSANGYGPGRGTGYGGGGHGGYGGKGSAISATYGSIYTPTNPGSGGGETATTGSGGGAVLVQASGTVTVNGTVSANGGNGGAGGGSGGSIFITCSTFYGTNGAVRANGGSGAQGSGGTGGGGRIAVVYDQAAQAEAPLPTVRFSAAYGIHGSALVANMGDMGTLYFPDGSLLDRTFVAHCGELTAPAFTNWTASALTFSNCQFRFAQDSMAVTITNNLVVLGTNVSMCKVQWSNTVVTCGGDLRVNSSHLLLCRGATSGPSLTCGGNLLLTNSGYLSIYGGITNGTALTNDGAVVTVAGSVTIATNSWLYACSHPASGGSPLFEVGSLTVAAGGGLDATARGYGSMRAPSITHTQR